MRSEVLGALAHDPGSLRAAFRKTRTDSLKISERLSAEDCQAQSMDDASPIKWHLAHTTWFFATFVLEPCGQRPFAAEPSFRHLFNSYYRGVGKAFPRAKRGLLVRPSLQQVLAFRARVDGMVLELTDLDFSRCAAAIELGLQHEQQHQELMLTDLKHLLWCTDQVYDQALAAEDFWDRGAQPAQASPTWATFDGGLCVVGHQGSGFAYDNEQPAHRVWLEPFELRTACITYREVGEFMRAAGYQTPSLWLDAGFSWVEQAGIERPLYLRSADSLEVFTLGGWVSVQGALLDAPCAHLSFYEADAVARFLGAELPTESQWEVFCREQRGAAWDLHQVWEWTGSAYRPYPGFRATAGALGEYNGKFMDGCYVLRGASRFTPRGHERASYRNFFHPESRWQRAGARLCRRPEGAGRS